MIGPALSGRRSRPSLSCRRKNASCIVRQRTFPANQEGIGRFRRQKWKIQGGMLGSAPPACEPVKEVVEESCGDQPILRAEECVQWKSSCGAALYLPRFSCLRSSTLARGTSMTCVDAGALGHARGSGPPVFRMHSPVPCATGQGPGNRFANADITWSWHAKNTACQEHVISADITCSWHAKNTACQEHVISPGEERGVCHRLPKPSGLPS